MKFSIFNNGKAAKSGVECTAEVFSRRTSCQSICDTQKAIIQALKEGDTESYRKLKTYLPAVTWQAFFPDGERKAEKAVPSGLFMLDFDHVDEKMEELGKVCRANREKCDIVLMNYTASKKGLRLVAKCQPQHHDIKEAQAWLWEQCGAKALGVEYDKNCFDWARCDFRPHESYVLYMDFKGIFEDEPKCTYTLRYDDDNDDDNENDNDTLRYDDDNDDDNDAPRYVDDAPAATMTKEARGLITEYKEVPLKEIAMEWLEMNGGVPQVGTRNTQLYKLARNLRYICDFDEASIIAAIPHCGLGRKEVESLVASAIKATRGGAIPEDILRAYDRCKINAMVGEVDDEDNDKAIELTDTSKIPPLPPIFKEWFDVAPEDYKIPSVVIQLPILGTLGSKLRAAYIDGQLHSPSFQVSLEAPQASGKSFMRSIADYELKSMKEQDEVSREKERAYLDRVKESRLTNTKMTKEEKNRLGDKPTPIIRYLPPTMSITEMLIRTQNAKGLHLFAMSEEIDTVYKAFKRGFSSFSDALRNAFDNAEYGQDYASDTSFSGIVHLYYNVLYSGTPKAMRRFYPDIEDGLVSRVFFCTLPDQFGKPFQKWAEFTSEQKQIVDINLVRLEEVSLIGEEVQPDHVMKMNWLAEHMLLWVRAQQELAGRMEDRTRDTFCRRAAVVGFRAGMLAHFLYGEVNTPTIRRKVKEFAVWISNLMLKQHLMRFKCEDENRNIFKFKSVYDKLPKQFTAKMLAKEMSAEEKNTNPTQVIYLWKLAGKIASDKDSKGVYSKIEMNIGGSGDESGTQE